MTLHEFPSGRAREIDPRTVLAVHAFPLRPDGAHVIYFSLGSTHSPPRLLPVLEDPRKVWELGSAELGRDPSWRAPE